MNANLANHHFGNMVIAPLGPSDAVNCISPVDIKTIYINNSCAAITCGLRSGLKFVLPRQSNFNPNALIVRVRYSFTNSARDDIQKVLSAINENSSNELQVMKEALAFQVKENKHRSAMFTIDYVITYNDLKENGGTLYHHELDMIFSILPIDEVPPHNFSRDGLKVALLNKNNTDKAFNYSVDIVDNLSRYGSRFITIGKKVYKINTVKDSTRVDGIYIIGNESVISNIDINPNNVKYIPFEEGVDKELGLYRTYEEAKNSIEDEAIVNKAEILKEQHNVNITKVELEEKKQATELHSMELNRLEATMKSIVEDANRREKQMLEDSKRKDEEIQRERDKLNTERKEDLLRKEEAAKIRYMEREDYYDRKSYERKDSSETLKWVGTAIVAVGSLFVVMKSL